MRTLNAAIFDLDGTLYTGHIGTGIFRHHRIHRVKRSHFYLYFGAHIPLWLVRKLGLISKQAERLSWARHMGWTVRGWTPQEAEAAFKWIASEYVQPLIRQDVLQLLREHQRAGDRAILVSGTIQPLLREIARMLEVEEWVGTPLVIRDGRYTGASEHPPCQGPGKLERLKMHLAEAGDIAWETSIAYADSHTDLPLLEQFGNPVAVHPDAALRRHAEQMGWRILS